MLPLEILIMVFDKVNHKDLIYYSKYFEFAKSCLKKKFKTEPMSLRIGAKCGSVYVLENLLDKDKFYYELYYLADDAAENGHLSTLKWLTDKNVLPTQTVRNLTAYNGHLEVLVWLDKYYPIKYPRQYNTAMYFAIQANHFTIVKYFAYKLTEINKKECHFKIYRRILREACENGNIQVIKWILDKYDAASLNDSYSEFNDVPNTLDLLVPNGYICLIKYLYPLGFNPSFFSVIYAAQNNHLSILKWLHKNTDILNENRIRDTDYPLIDAAKIGHKDIVRWFIQTFEYPQEVLDLALDSAMMNCHFEIVKFLKENTPAKNTRWFPLKNL